LRKKVIVTGSAGLIGSEAVLHFDRLGWDVIGVDNNMRADFFGKDGDTSWNLNRLRSSAKSYQHHSIDIRDRPRIVELYASVRPDLTIHCAAQPSHDLAKDRPFDDFDTNAVGTLNLLEANRCHSLDSPFIFTSTNKVYGDAPNELSMVELETRYDYADLKDYHGIDETCRIDATLHSLFGASKVAADVMVQEYGRYFQMPTVCLRGCLTGPNHSAAELHGFLAYLAKAVREGRKYRIFGYKGKQVRDNIHSGDVCAFFEEFYMSPRVAAVYNIGGGRENSISMLEAICAFEQLIGRKLDVTLLEENRVGDHICYLSDLRRIRADYPNWKLRYDIKTVLRDVAGAK
jgi:CDP-paratose 2-epimerase